MSLFTRAPSSGVALPASAQRAVYLFRLSGRTFATRLLLFRSGLDLAQYCGYSSVEPLYSSFEIAHLQARVGRKKRLLGELRLPRDLSELESIAFVVFHLCDFCERNGHGTQAECSELAGQLGGVVYEDLLRWCVPVETTRRDMKQVRRLTPAEHAVFIFWLHTKYGAVRLIEETGETGPEIEPCGQLRLPIFPNHAADAEDESPASASYWSQAGDVRLDRQGMGFDDILMQIYPLVAQLRRRRRLDEQGGAYLFGELVASVCLELAKLSIPVTPLLNRPAIARIGDQWKLLPA